jgi:hypothetical protein
LTLDIEENIHKSQISEFILMKLSDSDFFNYSINLQISGIKSSYHHDQRFMAFHKMFNELIIKVHFNLLKEHCSTLAL